MPNDNSCSSSPLILPSTSSNIYLLFWIQRRGYMLYELVSLSLNNEFLGNILFGKLSLYNPLKERNALTVPLLILTLPFKLLLCDCIVFWPKCILLYWLKLIINTTKYFISWRSIYFYLQKACTIIWLTQCILYNTRNLSDINAISMVCCTDKYLAVRFGSCLHVHSCESQHTN